MNFLIATLQLFFSILFGFDLPPLPIPAITRQHRRISNEQRLYIIAVLVERARSNPAKAHVYHAKIEAHTQAHEADDFEP